MNKTLFFFLSFLYILPVSFAKSNMQVYDTIAGYPTIIEAENTSSDIVIIEKPNQEKLSFRLDRVKGNSLSADIDGYHTQLSGMYRVYFPSSSSVQASFTVSPAEFSPEKSYISLEKETSPLNELVPVSVCMTDSFLNPLVSEEVFLFSSRDSDVITVKENGFTNETGCAQFFVQAEKEGVSSFTALLASFKKPLAKRANIHFFQESLLKDIGGNDALKNSFTASASFEKQEEFGILHHFDLEFPETVKINSSDNYLKIIAKDAQNRTVKNYEGTVKIAVIGDDNAVLPHNGSYSFTLADQGEKEFALALVFKTLGEVTIEVYDTEDSVINTFIKGSKTVEVKQSLEDSIENPLGDSVKLSSPYAGMTTAQAQILVSGTAPKNTNVDILLNDTKVAEVSVSPTGEFSQFITLLEQGENIVYVLSSFSKSVSEKVTVFLDSVPPEVMDFVLMPQGPVQPLEEYTVKVLSERNLSMAQIKIQGVLETLSPSKSNIGWYEASLFAPENPGDYAIDITIKDALGNTKTEHRYDTLTVVSQSIPLPSKITGGKASVSEESIRVSWNPDAFSSQYFVFLSASGSMKKIYEGEKNEVSLTGAEPNKTYVFRVQGVNSEEEKGEFSDEIRVTVNAPETVHLSAPSLRGVALNSQVTLSWDTFTEAALYKVEYGIQSKKYEANIFTEQTQARIIDLVNGAPYYFQVTAFSASGKELSPKYPEITLTPTGITPLSVSSQKDFAPKQQSFLTEQKEIQGKTGPELVFALGISLILTALFFALKKPAYAFSFALPVKKEERSGDKSSSVKGKIQF
jgi:hypothetical protein